MISCFKKDCPPWLFCNWWRKEGRIPLKHFWYDSFGFWRVNWCLHDTPIASLVADFSSFYSLFWLTGAGGEGYLGRKNICTYILYIFLVGFSPHFTLSWWLLEVVVGPWKTVNTVRSVHTALRLPWSLPIRKRNQLPRENGRFFLEETNSSAMGGSWWLDRLESSTWLLFSSWSPVDSSLHLSKWH